MHFDAEFEAVLHGVFGDFVYLVARWRCIDFSENPAHLTRVFFLAFWRGIIELVFATWFTDVGRKARAHFGHLVDPSVCYFV